MPTDTTSGSFPLSVGQEGLWLLHKLTPDSATYNLAGGVRMEPAPDPDVLARAVRALTARHPMLRSVYTESGGDPCRVLREPDELPGPVLREVPDADDKELDRLIAAEARRPFRLGEEGPFRVTVLRREHDAAVLAIAHHIATDAISQWVLWRDLLHAYEEYAAGREPEWTPLATTYEEFVARERDLLASSRGRRQAEYWQEQCEGSAAAELPTDHTRPAVPSYRGASIVRRLPDSLSDRVKATAAEREVSPFALTLGAFQSLLHRWTGQTDFLLACPASTRRSASADVVGYFINPVLLRGRFAPATTLGDAMAAANERIRQGTARVTYPYPLIAQQAKASGPLYRISVTMVTTDRFDTGWEGAVAGEVLKVAGLATTYLEIPHLEGQCDVSLEITRDAFGLTVALRYDTDLFERATMERLFDQFTRFVEAAADSPERRVSRIPLMDEAEKRKLLALSSGAAS